ncbi:hypothetical protein IFR05_015118 [Cadophora sp. M221]|nr:hypothetical protein IFR05_015118 [Cadophora sp. M221]
MAATEEDIVASTAEVVTAAALPASAAINKLPPAAADGAATGNKQTDGSDSTPNYDITA